MGGLATIAIDNDGICYGINLDGYESFGMVSLETGAYIKIADIPMSLNVLQSLGIDRKTNELYWGVLEGTLTTTRLNKIDPASGALTQVGVFPAGHPFAAFAILADYAYAAPAAPAAPTNFTLTPAADGTRSCTLSWTNPSQTLGGGPLSELTSVVIERDGVVIHTIPSPTPGADVTWTDTTPALGNSLYTIYGVSSSGNGTFVSQTVFVGSTPIYTVTVTGSYAATSGAGSYTSGDTVTISAGSRSDYRFDGWTASGVALAAPQDATTTFVMPAGNVTVTASWVYTGTPDTPNTPGTPGTPDTPDATQGAPATVPAGDGTVAVEYSESDGAVTLHLPAAKVDEMIESETDGAATLDLSDVEGATSATLPQTALQQIADAGLAVEIRLPHGTITLEADGPESAALFEGERVTLSLDAVEPSSLTTAQQEQLAPNDLVFDITLLVDDKAVHAPGATITVTLPYSGPPPVAVWYLNDAGELERLECTYRDGFVQFSTDHLSLYVVGHDEDASAWQSPFVDVAQGDWYYSAVAYVAQSGLMKGVGSNLFSPDTPLTRGMAATILYRAAGSPDVRGLDRLFSDVAEGSWYEDAVQWAAETDIAAGFDGRFSPDDAITRQDLATLLWRYAVYAGADVSVGEDTNILSYPDAFDIAEYATPAMQWAAGAGMITGKPGGLLDPTGQASRAEAAAMLSRLPSLYFHK